MAPPRQVLAMLLVGEVGKAPFCGTKTMSCCSIVKLLWVPLPLYTTTLGKMPGTPDVVKTGTENLILNGTYSPFGLKNWAQVKQHLEN